MTINLKEMVDNGTLYVHHTASRRGYVSRKVDGIIKNYSGRFGNGYIVLTPRFDTTQYVYVTYYIKK